MRKQRVKLYSYRQKRGFILFPKWDYFTSASDTLALIHARNVIEFSRSVLRFRYPFIKVQKQTGVKWGKVRNG